MIRKFTLSLVALATVLSAFVTAQPAAAESTLQCSEHILNVTLAPGAADTYQVIGTLCSQGPAEGKTVQLLLHGITYARYYWDFPYQTEHYSYVRSAAKRGYVTFNLDRIGNGASDHPADSSLVDLDSNAYVVHQVVEALRAGQVGSTSFAKIIVVGHSMGSMVAARYASSFPGEADGIILTGLLHSINWDFAYASLIPNLYPALLDPKFTGQFTDPYYLTTIPGTRNAFYYLPNTDPQVVTLDESLKQVVTMAEFQTGPSVVYDQSSLQITGPVQMVIGQYDYLFCGPEVNFNCSNQAAVQAYEETKFSASACLETEVINDAGHDLNLHMNANATYSQMLAWADRNVGSTADPAPEPCGAP